MNYEYMKEYQCNGEKPDLPDDVLVDVATDTVGFDLEYELRVSNVCWHNVKKFRVIDDRYNKRSHNSFVVEIFQTGEKIDIGNAIQETVKAGKQKSDWFERGELPPVGERVEIRTSTNKWHSSEYIICGYAPNKNHVFIFWVDESEPETYRVSDIEFRPLRTGEDELIDKVAEAIHNGVSKNRAYKDIAIALHDVGMLKMPEKKNGQ